MQLEKRLKQALELQQKGQWRAAEGLFKQVLSSRPLDFVSLYSLGVISVQNGKLPQALQYFDKASEVNPSFAATWYNRGLVLQLLKRDRDALHSFDRALSFDPSHADSLARRAQLLKELQERTELEQGLRSDLAEKATRGIELQQQGDFDEAEAVFREILEQKPWDFVSLYSLGVIAQQKGNPELALRYFDATAKANPQYAPIWYNRGGSLHSLRRNAEALESYDRALEIDRNYAEAYVNRGAVLQEMSRHAEALENYNQLLRLHPKNDKGLGNKGILLTEFKRNDEAQEVFRELLRVNPDYEYGPGLLCFAQLHSCNWEGLEALSDTISRGIAQGKRTCKSLALFAISGDPQAHLLCSRTFARHHYPVQEPVWRGELYRHQKIRIAYISPDFREHPVGHLTAGIFENHDRSRFETFALSLGIDDQSRLRSRISAAFDQFIDVRQKNSRDIALLMRSLEIDIAVDLAGYTADSRTAIFAYRPAPIQVNYLGYAGTMGAEYMDYIIGDRHIIPEADREHFSEKVVYLPDTYLPTDASLQVAEGTPPRAAFGLPERGFVFCSFNHAYKINPTVFDIWMRLLDRVPGSVLWLMKLTDSAMTNLRNEARARGIDPERLVFASRVPRVEDHLARYRLADLFLDTTPYNAHTTASDALLVGLPVLTCRGSAFPGRVASGLLHAIGLPELVTGSLEEYEELACRLATEPGLLAGIRGRLREHRASYPLFDTVKFCRHLESAYQGMWERYQRGAAPESFAVGEPGAGVIL